MDGQGKIKMYYGMSRMLKCWHQEKRLLHIGVDWLITVTHEQLSTKETPTIMLDKTDKTTVFVIGS